MRSVTKYLSAAVLGVATACGALLPAGTAAAAPAAPAAVTAQAAIGIDVAKSVVDVTNRLYNIVSDAIAHDQNRGGYVKSLMEGAFYDAGQRYNVMVVKSDHPYSFSLVNIVYDARVSSGAYPDFRVLVFDSGQFTNHGDGSYINWAYRGWFTRSGMTVTFRKP